jgi:hypothetical protein
VADGWIDFASWDVRALGAVWRAARPFPHLVVDELLAPARLEELRAAVAREPHWPDRADLFELMASADPPGDATLAAFAAALDGGRAALGAIADKALGRVELRSYVYLPGSYLLPHSDARADARRALAFAFYLSRDDEFEGGELEFFDCTLDGAGEVIATRPAAQLRPAANRLVLFDVSPRSLHQVREVRAGGRVSLSGWFYP